MGPQQPAVGDTQQPHGHPQLVAMVLQGTIENRLCLQRAPGRQRILLG